MLVSWCYCFLVMLQFCAGLLCCWVPLFVRVCFPLAPDELSDVNPGLVSIMPCFLRVCTCFDLYVG